MHLDKIKAIDLQARHFYTYTEDDPKHDTWRSLAHEVATGIPWKGDCDDIASTALHLLGKAGVPLKDRYRLLVGVNSPTTNHMIGVVRDDEGVFWVVGDTYRGTYRADLCVYTMLHYNRLSEIKPNGDAIWRQGKPWDIID